MKRDFPLIVAGLFAGICAQAEEVRLEWQPDQISSRLGYYYPVRLELGATKPDGVTKLPDGLKAPLYGTLKFGPQESPTKATVVLDEPADGPARLWIDRNANGDLTDDPPVKWDARKEGETMVTWGGSAAVETAYGAEKRALGLSMYRFNKDDPKRAGLRNTLLYYRTCGFSGNVSLGGKSYAAVLTDDAATGDFRGTDAATGPRVNLLLDLNGDGRFDSKAERFDVRKPFNVAGTTYEITGLTASGGTFTIAKSDKTVAELPKAPVLGDRPFAFQQKNTLGEPVRFPEDYKGKLVLLDFWATWCGPCVKELPNVTKVYEEFHPKGFEILGVSLDSASGLAKLAQFTKDKGMPWPQVCDTKGWPSPLVEGYSVHGIPAAFLVDGKSGAIVAMGSDLRGEQLRTTVERCLAKLGAAAPAKISSSVPPPSTPPEATAPEPVAPDAVVAKATELLKQGKLLAADTFAAQKQNPQPAPVALAPAGTAPLPGREIARRAAAGYVRAGWFYQCTTCGRWHVNLAGGYAVANDTVVTAHHVMQPPQSMKPGVGHPILVRGESEVLPVTAVVADDAASDAIVLRAAVEDLSPLPLGGDVQVGDSVWCLSDPRGERGYFSTGIVNRFVERTVGDPRGRRINLSTDWAPGSSGAAVLDVAGNVIGHVATIRALFGKAPTHSPEAKPGDPATGTAAMAMNLHEAIPAKSVLAIIPK
ncbi:MAG: thioredoxin family protein [Verrucomicrobia bacterium]|nr:thioredoxin family protein [Verrucomicrobiota bacterium]